MLNIDVITIFPDFFSSPLQSSIVGKALSQSVAKVKVHNLRDFGVGKHQLTDDRPFGGGPGMVMMIEPIDKTLQALGYKKGTAHQKIVLTSAAGKLFTQQTARDWAKLDRICIICGHYEGVDERVSTHLVDEEIRIGDYVLTGGEPATLVIIDSLVRLLPGSLGNQASLEDESHDKPGQFAWPQYTRPEKYQDWSVPEVLTTGNHQDIAQYRQQNRKQS